MRRSIALFLLVSACGGRVEETKAVTVRSECGVPVADGEGHSYGTASFGAQCWMTDNLTVGARISASSEQANNGRVEKYCYGDDEQSCTSQGALYQLGEATGYTSSPRVRGICPEGWHIPTDEEFGALEEWLGCEEWRNDENGSDIDGYRCEGLGAKGNALGGFVKTYPGHRHYASTGPWVYGDKDKGAYFWTSTQSSDGTYQRGIRRKLETWSNKVARYAYSSQLGYSVRCIQD